MKKKILALLLVVVMVVVNSVVVFGASSQYQNIGLTERGGNLTPSNSEDNTKLSHQVDVNFTSAEQAVYSVNIEWGSMTFNYTQGTWLPSSHTYNNSSWDVTSQEDNNIKVTNHSNKQIKVSMNTGAEGLAIKASGVTANNIKGEFRDIKSGDTSGSSITCSGTAIVNPSTSAENVDRGVLDDPSNAKFCKKELNITGDIEKPGNNANDTVKIGDITITLGI